MPPLGYKNDYLHNDGVRPASSGSKYVPPHLRNKSQGSGGSSGPPPSSSSFASGGRGGGGGGGG